MNSFEPCKSLAGMSRLLSYSCLTDLIRVSVCMCVFNLLHLYLKSRIMESVPVSGDQDFKT